MSRIPNFSAAYLRFIDHDDVLSGGVKMTQWTPRRAFYRVWTKRIGNHPTMKVLLLHGRPGVTHEYLEAFDSYFPAAGIEYYYYDQLGSYYSDSRMSQSCGSWRALLRKWSRCANLTARSQELLPIRPVWGGLLAMEYALKYQARLKGLVITNMMAGAPA